MTKKNQLINSDYCLFLMQEAERLRICSEEKDRINVFKYEVIETMHKLGCNTLSINTAMCKINVSLSACLRVDF